VTERIYWFVLGAATAVAIALSLVIFHELTSPVIHWHFMPTHRQIWA